MRRTAALLLGLALVFGVAACGDDEPAADGTTTTADRGAATTTTVGAPGASTTVPIVPEGAAGTTVTLSESNFGPILVDGDGMTLYRFTPDTGTTSTCTGDCADAWPPLAGPATGVGIDAGELGTTTRDDESVQTTYAGHPLYLFAGDSAPGDVTGQGSGGKWFVVNAEGETVTSETGSAGPATTVTPRSDGY